jgi:hypothetical protein
VVHGWFDHTVDDENADVSRYTSTGRAEHDHEWNSHKYNDADRMCFPDNDAVSNLSSDREASVPEL